jgi:hypothetical protein
LSPSRVISLFSTASGPILWSTSTPPFLSNGYQRVKWQGRGADT